MKGRVSRGAAVSGVAQAVRVFVQFFSVVIVSRFLTPEAFGIVAMVAPILGLAALMQEFGITQAIVQKARLSHVEASTLFFIGFGISLLMALVLLAIAPLVASFYREPQTAALVSAMAIVVLVTGLGAQHIALLNRAMRFGMLAMLDAGGAVAGLAATLIWLYFDPSFWAIYIGSLVAAAVPAAGAWAAVRWVPGRPRRNTGARGAIHFGAGITGFNLANFFARNLDNVLIGRAWGQHVLGLYDRAYKLMLLPIQQINAPLSRVMLPALSRMVDEPDRYRYAFLRTMRQILLVTLPGLACLTIKADVVVPLLLGDAWAGAAPIFAALGFAGLVQTLNNPCGWLFVSQSRTWEFMRWGVFNAITCVIGFLIGLPYGAVGVAIVYAIGEYIRTPLLWAYLCRRGPVRRHDILSLGLQHYGAAFVAMAAVYAIGLVMPAGVPAIVTLGLCVVVAYAVSFAVVGMFPQGRTAITDSLALVTASVGRLRRTGASA